MHFTLPPCPSVGKACPVHDPGLARQPVPATALRCITSGQFAAVVVLLPTQQDERIRFAPGRVQRLVFRYMFGRQAVEVEQLPAACRAHGHEALEGLDERSRDILYQRWLAEEKATLHDLAQKYNVAAERIRQIEKSAMNKLKLSIAA